MSKKGLVLALTEARSWRPLGISALVIAGFVLVVGTFLGPIEAGEPTVTELLKALDLSGYPATMRPPEFSVRTNQHKTVSLAGLRGRVVLLNFWASWCPDCRPEMPMFEQLHRDLATKGLTVLGVNVRERAHTVQDYAKELGLTFPLVLDPQGEVYASYGVIGIPTTFLIGRDGRAVALAIGPRDWASTPARSIIQSLLAEQAALKGIR